jgi:hypothetical protein
VLIAAGVPASAHRAGPRSLAVTDFANDFGTGRSVIVAAVVVGLVGVELARRHRLRSRPER